MSRFTESLRSLGYRNFRLFFTGQLISLVGTWMQSVALSWLVYRLTGKPSLLGLVAFASQAPIFLLGSFGGVLADRMDARKLVVITQTLQMVQALGLSARTASSGEDALALADERKVKLLNGEVAATALASV